MLSQLSWPLEADALLSSFALYTVPVRAFLVLNDEAAKRFGIVALNFYKKRG